MAWRRRLGGQGSCASVGRSLAHRTNPSAAAAYRTHEYNWSITTARALSITLDLGWRPSVRPTVVYTLVRSQRPPVRSRCQFASASSALQAAHPCSTYRWKGQKTPETMAAFVFRNSLVCVHQTVGKSCSDQTIVVTCLFDGRMQLELFEKRHRVCQ